MNSFLETSKRIDLISTQVNVNPMKSHLIFCIDIVVISLLTIATVYLDTIYLHQPLNESSVTELSQQFLLVVIAGRFLFEARKALDYAMMLAGSFFIMLLIRELDHWFDYIQHGSWVYPALLVAGLSLFYFLKNSDSSFSQFMNLLNNPNAPLLMLGTVFLIVLSRLAGMGAFWHEIMGDHYMRIVKNVVEEGTELFGYYLIALATFKVTKSQSGAKR